MATRIRLWPVYVLLVVGAIAQIYIWTANLGHRQWAVMLSIAAVAVGLILLLIWALAFSQLPGRLKLKAASVCLVSIVLIGSTVHIHGVTGDLVPILSWRWSEPEYGTLTSALPVSRAQTSDYAQFLGPTRNAVLNDVRLADWSEHPPKEVWRITVGPAWSAFSVAGHLAITQEQRGDDECVVAYDLLTGKEQWIHRNEARYQTSIGGIGPRATPTIDHNQVYSIGATGWLNCLDLATGRELWSRNIVDEHNTRLPDWGLSGSPLILNGNVVVSPGGKDDRSLVAYTAEDGKLVWGGGTRRAGYSSPALHRVAGRDQILIFNRGAVAGHDPTTGEIYWEESWPMPGGNQCVAQPLPLNENQVFVSTGYGVGCKLFDIREKGGEMEVSVVYKTPRLKLKFTQAVLHEGYLYGLDDGVLVCLDPATGQRKWKRGRYGHGQILLAGDKLIVQTEDGPVKLINPNPEGLVELATLDALDGKTWNNPVLAGSLLIVRNDSEAVCYRVRLETEDQT